MQRNLVLFIAVLAAIVVGCRDNPVTPPGQLGDELITNGAFTTTLSQGGNIVTGNEAAPWKAAYGSPQIGAGAGCDGRLGYLQMWGNYDLGECAYQTLATPIRKGHRYVLTAQARFMDDNPANYTRQARVRFVAYNTAPATENLHWHPSPGNVAVIGTLTTGETAWKQFNVGEWTADADYAAFAVNAENDTRDNDTPNTVSWVNVDNVSLREKK
ncbi:MAG: hypothetical protein JST22_09675 [Bacteroidetes bacterium]|nr:hypothetical protein [Bacteroidota bacterium]